MLHTLSGNVCIGDANKQPRTFSIMSTSAIQHPGALSKAFSDFSEVSNLELHCACAFAVFFFRESKVIKGAVLCNRKPVT